MRLSFEKAIRYHPFCNYQLSEMYYQENKAFVRANQCFDNADMFLRNNNEKEKTYIVYGYVISGIAKIDGIYVPHGWNMIRNTFFDITAVMYGYDEKNMSCFGYIPYFILSKDEYDILISHSPCMPDILMQQDNDFKKKIEQMGYCKLDVGKRRTYEYVMD